MPRVVGATGRRIPGGLRLPAPEPADGLVFQRDCLVFGVQICGSTASEGQQLFFGWQRNVLLALLSVLMSQASCQRASCEIQNCLLKSLPAR